MNSAPRPTDESPAGMTGSARMADPSERQQDRQRRRWMAVSFFPIVGLNVLDVWLAQPDWREWSTVLLLAVAAIPLGLAIKVFELRFKMARAERQQVLREIPQRRQVEYLVYAVFVMALFAGNIWHVSWGLLGAWLYDFVTYYHDRPHRVRHLYAVTKTLDELRNFRAPWAWAVPAGAWEIVRHLTR